MRYHITKFKKIIDVRGQLIIFLKNSELEKQHKNFGQIYFVTFNKKGVVRGNHYHKKWREWFGVVSGKVQVILEDVKTKKRKKFILDAVKDKYTRLETGPFIAHGIKCLSQKASLLSYTDTVWNKSDTYEYKLIK